jgi:hypothetical protein
MATAQATAPLRRIETPFGAAAWRALDWDTEQFGIPAARLDLLETSGSYTDARAHNRELLRAVLAECREGGIRHLSARVDTGDLATIPALEEAGFELIDGIQTFLLRIKGNPMPAPAGTRLFEPGDLPEILEIGRTAFFFDRFHADPALPAVVADRVNETWTRNCCLGSAADAVVVAEEEGRVASYVTCQADSQADARREMESSSWWPRPFGRAAEGRRAAPVPPPCTGSPTGESKPSRWALNSATFPPRAFMKAWGSG